MTPLYIFDLDGTLADTEHRLHILNGERTQETWSRFFSLCDQDKPMPPVISVFHALHSRGNDVWIWTGRSDEVLVKTEEWLDEHVWRCSRARRVLRMRPAGDHTADDVLKRRWLHGLTISERARIQGVFEDRNRVCQMWRNEGIPCFQVNEGAF